MFPRDPVSNVLSASIRNPEEQDDSCMPSRGVLSMQARDKSFERCNPQVPPQKFCA